MGENMKYYDVESFKEWKRKQGKAYKSPPRANFFAAANHIKNLLDGKKINWAVFGSLAMLCLGSRREMPDIHITYDDRDFQRLKIKLEADQRYRDPQAYRLSEAYRNRVRLPKGMNSLFSSKLLVMTGPKFKDANCTESMDIEVDLVPPGSHGTPQSDVMRNNQVMLRMGRDGKADNFKSLNMLYLVKTTLHFCNSQDLAWDPRKDLIFLCQHYGKEIEPIRQHLNSRQIQENLLGTSFFSRLPPEEQRGCYLVLLGKEPPPAMSITPAPPPGHRTTASTDAVPRPGIPAHKSSPSLNSAPQQSASHLIPPPLGKPKSTPTAPMSAQPTKPSAPIHSYLAGVGVSAGARDSQLRYRHGSAPNTPSANHNLGPSSNPSRPAQPMSMDPRAPQQQQAVPSHKPQPQNVHNATHAPRPQMNPDHAQPPMAAPPTAMRPQQSMPSITGRSSGAVPVFAHGRNDVPPVPMGAPNPHQPGSSIVPPPSAIPTHRRQQQDVPLRNGQNQSTATPPLPKHNPQMAGQSLPHQHRPTPDTQKAASSHGYHSVATMTYQTEYETPPQGLKLVGPEGLYPMPLRPNPKPQQNQHPNSTQSQNVQPSSSNHVFELDAGFSPPAKAPQQSSPSGFIAELPADLGTSQPAILPVSHQPHTYSEMSVSPPQGPSRTTSAHAVQYRDSPVSPPNETVTTFVRPPQPEPQARPPNPRTQSAPFDALPASLMIGGPRRSSPNNPNPYALPPQHPGNPHMDAGKYQHNYSPPSTALNSMNPSPRQTQGTAYRAYHGSVSPPEQPATAPAKLQQPPPVAHAQAPMPTSRSHAPSQEPSYRAPALPANTVMGAPHAAVPRKDLPNHLPKPLNTNQPAPSVTHLTHLTKHDSHQGHKEHAIKGGAAVVGVGVVAGTGYAAYSYQSTEYHEVDMTPTQYHADVTPTQYQPPHQEDHYVPFGNTQAPDYSEPRNVGHENPYAQNFFTPPPEQPAFEYTHHRNISHDSTSSTTSHDSEKLAQEYQMDLPDFDNGYSSDAQSYSSKRRSDGYHSDEYPDFS